MTKRVQPEHWIVTSQYERDLLATLKPVLEGTRTIAQAARLLELSTRQVRRIVRRLREHGDQGIVHRLRGKPSNRAIDPNSRQAILDRYREQYHDFGPTLACEKLREEGFDIRSETLRRWLIREGLRQPTRKRDPHRSRRPRRDCFGELVQMDASIHDWLEGRGETAVLIAMIDDATSRVMARFYAHGTVETHMDLLKRWLLAHGRPVALYTDRHSIFEAQNKGKEVIEGSTQFGRALETLKIKLIRAHSPQAKGRVERLFGTAQDRWVKELRLMKVSTIEKANEVLMRLLREHNERFGRAAKDGSDGHRELGEFDTESILSIQTERVVGNDYTIRFRRRVYQLLPPVYPGERGGKVVIEERLNGSMWIRYGGQYISYREVPSEQKPVSKKGKQASSKTPVSEKKRIPSPDHPWRNATKKKR